MNILTLGNGFIANHLPYTKYLEKLALDSSAFEDQVINKYKPNVIVNTIGYCGQNTIDSCESEKERTLLTNTTLPTILAATCAKYNIKFIHISSGCIFYGKSPNSKISGYRLIAGRNEYEVDHEPIYTDSGWKEEDHANPLSFYSKTKYAADLAISDLPNTTILRIRMPISSMKSPRNFISKIKNYPKLIDIPNSVTMLPDLVRAIDWFANNDKTGIYHVTNSEPLSAAQVIREYQKYKTHQFEVINERELAKLTIATRSNCLLDNSKLSKSGFEMSSSTELLTQIMKDYINN